MCWKHSVELLKTLLCIKLILYFSKISSCQQATWIVTPDALEARTGSSAEFNWTYQENGVGINGIEWRKVNGSRVMLYFDNTTIGYGEYEGRVDKVGNAGLRIFPVVKNDTGMYSCRVTVGLGDSLYDVSPSMGVHDLPVGAQLKADFILLDIHSNETIASSAQIQGGTEVSLRVPVMINDPPSVSVKAEYKYDSDDEYKELKAWHGLTNTICEYNFSVTAGDRKTMDLSIRVQADHPVFDTEVSIKNYTVTDLCTSSPCENEGTCVPSGNTYYCNCTSNYKGNNCEEIIPDPCASNPCQNNGTCVDPRGDSYTCNCASNYEGENCERTKPVSDNLEWWIILLIVLAVLLFVGGIIAAILYFFCRDKIKQVREDQKDTTNEKNRSAQHSNHKESQEVTLDINSEPEPESESDMAPRSHGLISKQPPTDMKMQKLEASESHPHADTPMSGPLH